MYFDDFKVEHIKSPVVSSQSYYPFGLSFDFYNRENSLANQYKFNGKEEQDELDLGLYDYKKRFYSAVLGRFISIDPLADKFPWWTPYQFTGNMPTKYVDLDGMEPASYDFKNGKVYPASDHFRYTPPPGTVPQESYPKGGAGVLNVVGTLSDMVEAPTDPKNTGSNSGSLKNLNKTSKIVGPVADIADVAWDASTTDFSDPKQTGDFVENTAATVVAAGFGPAAPAAAFIMSDTQKPSGTTNPLNLRNSYSVTFRQQNSMINARIKLLKDSYTGNNQTGQTGTSTTTSTTTSGTSGSGSTSSSGSNNSSNKSTSCPDGKCPQ